VMGGTSTQVSIVGHSILRALVVMTALAGAAAATQSVRKKRPPATPSQARTAPAIEVVELSK